MLPTTPMKAIRLKCLDCCVGNANEVRLCSISSCPLYAYRFGHRPPKGIQEYPEDDVDNETTSYDGVGEDTEGTDVKTDIAG